MIAWHERADASQPEANGCRWFPNRDGSLWMRRGAMSRAGEPKEKCTDNSDSRQVKLAGPEWPNLWSNDEQSDSLSMVPNFGREMHMTILVPARSPSTKRPNKFLQTVFHQGQFLQSAGHILIEQVMLRVSAACGS